MSGKIEPGIVRKITKPAMAKGVRQRAQTVTPADAPAEMHPRLVAKAKMPSLKVWAKQDQIAIEVPREGTVKA